MADGCIAVSVSVKRQEWKQQKGQRMQMQPFFANVLVRLVESYG